MRYQVLISTGKTIAVTAKSRDHAIAVFDRNPLWLDRGATIVDIQPAPTRKGRHRAASAKRKAEMRDPFEIKRSL